MNWQNLAMLSHLNYSQKPFEKYESKALQNLVTTTHKIACFSHAKLNINCVLHYRFNNWSMITCIHLQGGIVDRCFSIWAVTTTSSTLFRKNFRLVCYCFTLLELVWWYPPRLFCCVLLYSNSALLLDYLRWCSAPISACLRRGLLWQWKLYWWQVISRLGMFSCNKDFSPSPDFCSFVAFNRSWYP